MRYTYLLIALLIGVLTACNTANTNDEFEPKRIGTWEVAAWDSANWIGKSSAPKLKSDSILISVPNEVSVTIVKMEQFDKNRFWLNVEDSSYNALDGLRPRFDFGSGKYIDEYLITGSANSSANADRLRTMVDGHINCGESDFIEAEEFVYVNYYDKNTDTLRVTYVIEVDGMVETILNISC